METKIVWFSIVVFTAMGMPLVQIDDQRGPYKDIQTCYTRGAEVIKDLNSGKFPPIIHAQAFCVDKTAKVPEEKV